MTGKTKRPTAALAAIFNSVSVRRCPFIQGSGTG
jgi:hypothetical protein